MQSYSLTRFGDISGLMLVEQPVPEPGPREVLVRIRATSLNYRDLMILNGKYPVPTAAGTIPVSDGAGEVVAAGDKVTRFAVGDRVTSSYFINWVGGRLTADLARHQLGASHDGMLTTFRALDQDWLVKMPDHLSFEEAATLPCAALTAWSAVSDGRRILPGEHVLVVGGGGVAMFAIQFARLSGARIISVTSKASKAERLRQLGAHDVIVTPEHPDWDRNVADLTEGKGVDHVIEAVGPATLGRTIRACALDAEIALAGIFAGAEGFDPGLLAGRLITIRRLAVGSRSAFEAMNRAIALHQLRPAIDKVFPFSEAQSAYQHFAAGHHSGKVVIAGPA